VTRLMPDNTWVQQFDLKQAGKTREVQITGETTSASRLIEIMEQSQLLKSAQTRGTITRGSQPGTERFMIAAEVKPTNPPEPTGVGDAAPRAPAAAAPAAAPPAPSPAAAKVEPVPAKVDPKAAPKPAPGK
jgi:general secretion pathway protein L